MNQDPLAFLQLFGDNFWIQTFDDRKKNKSMTYSYPRKLEELTSFFGLARVLNKENAGIFFCVNQIKEKVTTRRAENVENITAFFVDLDGAAREPVLCCKLLPNIEVNSSNGRWHYYWLMDDRVPADRRLFKDLQHSIAKRFNGDESVSDLCRVMRLPGFYNMKKEPFMVTYEVLRLKPYSLKEVQDEFGGQVIPENSGALRNLGSHCTCIWATAEELSKDAGRGNIAAALGDLEFDAARLRGALIAIDPDPYDTWITVGMALQGAARRTDSELTEDEAYEYWLSWSELSGKFDSAMAEQKWQGFEARGEMGLGTVFQLAKDAGWKGERRNFWTKEEMQEYLKEQA